MTILAWVDNDYLKVDLFIPLKEPFSFWLKDRETIQRSAMYERMGDFLGLPAHRGEAAMCFMNALYEGIVREWAEGTTNTADAYGVALSAAFDLDTEGLGELGTDLGVGDTEFTTTIYGLQSTLAELVARAVYPKVDKLFRRSGDASRLRGR